MLHLAIPPTFRDVVGAEIKPPEKILWAAQPEPGKGIPWEAYGAAFVGAGQLVVSYYVVFDGVPRGSWLNAIFVLPFLVIGGGLLTCPSWMRRRIRYAAENTLYVITDRRAVDFNGGYHGTRSAGTFLCVIYQLRFSALRNIRIFSFAPEKLKFVERVRHSDGTEDLLFLESRPRTGAKRPVTYLQEGFHSVPDAEKAQKLLRELVHGE
jgi:hypothetical protein